MQHAQGDEAGEEFGVGALLRPPIWPCGNDDRIGSLGIAVMQQLARQQVPLGPERGRVAGIRRPDQQRGRLGVVVGVAQDAGAVQGQAGIGAQCGRQRGDQRLGLRIVPLGGEAGLGRRMVCGIKAGDLAGGGGRVGQPGEALKPSPLVVGGGDAAPAAEEGGLVGCDVDGVDPGLAGQGIGVGGAAGVGGGLGAAQHGGAQRRRRGALGEDRRRRRGPWRWLLAGAAPATPGRASRGCAA